MARVKKGVLAQGTKVWLVHGDTPQLIRMDCIKGLNIGDDSNDEIDSTCLDETEASTSEYGLLKPGEGSVDIDTDPNNATHLKLLELADNKAVVEVYVGWSDGTDAPILDASSGDVTLPSNRTFTAFTAQLRANAPTFEANSLVKQTIPMKRQTRAITTYRTA